MSVIAVLIGFAVVAVVTGAILFAISGSLVESEDEIDEMLEERDGGGRGSVKVYKHLVFVYGTLRRGGVNALPVRFPGALFVGSGSARGRLYDLGEYPGLLVEEACAPVVGEVYEVDEAMMKELDEYEATADYGRRLVEVALGGGVESCWVYEPPAEVCQGRALIASGDWIEHARAKAGAARR